MHGGIFHSTVYSTNDEELNCAEIILELLFSLSRGTGDLKRFDKQAIQMCSRYFVNH